MAENNTFKFLDNKQSQGSDAAQDFLNEKLSKNKYMDTSDPSNPYSYGEGTVPGGEAYEMDRKVLNQDEVDASKKAAEASKGKLSAEEIREKFGLGYNEAHAAESHSNVQKGSDVANSGALYVKGEYIGTIDGFSAQDPNELHPGAGGISSLKAMEDYEQEHGLREGRRSAWNSYNDVAGAVRNIYGESAEEVKPVLEEMKPIEHSEEIKQAKDRVQQYENDVMSGKTSNEIYGKGEAIAEDKYVFDATQGAAGIGSSPVSASNQASTDATASFLDKKMSDTKNKYQFSSTS